MDSITHTSSAEPDSAGKVAILLLASSVRVLKDTPTDKQYNSGIYASMTCTLRDGQLTPHPIYAPIFQQERPASFNSPPHQLRYESLDIVCWNFDGLLDCRLDCVSPALHAAKSSSDLLSWCGAL